MRDDKETRKKLLESAAEEFMEMGYSKASLRNICKKVDVTTGALYFFFKDKEDLFANLVEEPMHHLYGLIRQHFMEESEELNLPKEQWSNDNDIEAAKMIIHYMYQNRQAFELLLLKSQGSRYENVKEQFVAIAEKHYGQMARQMAMLNGVKAPNDYFIHWVAHMSIDAFIHMLIHEPSEEKALKQIEPVVQFILQGWLAIL